MLKQGAFKNKDSQKWMSKPKILIKYGLLLSGFAVSGCEC